jgi:phosphatidate cytidylyltransferase
MTRILTAAVLIALLIGALALPWPAFAVAIALIAVLGWREFVGLVGALGVPLRTEGALFAAALALGFALLPPARALPFTAGVFLLVALWLVIRERHDPTLVTRAVGATCAGLLWLALPLGMQLSLRMQDHGVAWLLLLYASVALGDSAAFYGGTALGRHRLAPALSPKKSIEGSIFGLAGSAAGAALVSLWIPPLATPAAALLGLTLGAIGQAGDLLESSVKRAAGTKDSSNLLPGHGGVLDRIDAHLLAGAALWIALALGVIGG